MKTYINQRIFWKLNAYSTFDDSEKYKTNRRNSQWNFKHTYVRIVVWTKSTVQQTDMKIYLPLSQLIIIYMSKYLGLDNQIRPVYVCGGFVYGFSTLGANVSRCKRNDEGKMMIKWYRNRNVFECCAFPV